MTSVQSKIPWSRIILWAFLSHVILVVLSFAEVAIYSMLINPGQERVVYDAHVQVSSPYVAIIAGIPLFFLVARFLCIGRLSKRWTIALWYPIFYILMDIVILLIYGVEWNSIIGSTLLSFGTKFLFSYLGAWSVKA